MPSVTRCKFVVELPRSGLLEIDPPLKISPPPFLNEVVAKSAFLSKVFPPIYCCIVSLGPRLSTLNFVSRLWRKSETENPGFRTNTSTVSVPIKTVKVKWRPFVTECKFVAITRH